MIAAPIGPMIADAFDQVESVVRLTTAYPLVTIRSDDGSVFEPDFWFAEDSYFETFDFELLRGEAASVLDDPFSVVLDETSARTLFAEKDPVGQTLIVNGQFTFTVTGVMADPPSNTHLRLPMVASYASISASPNRNPDDFGMGSMAYLVLRPGVDITAFEADLAEFVASRINPSLRQPLSPAL